MPSLYLLRRDAERGTVMLVGLFGLVVLMYLTAMVYNYGDLLARRIRLQNAADAAAYSGAVECANSLRAIARINNSIVDHMRRNMKLLVDDDGNRIIWPNDRNLQQTRDEVMIDLDPDPEKYAVTYERDYRWTYWGAGPFNTYADHGIFTLGSQKQVDAVWAMSDAAYEIALAMPLQIEREIFRTVHGNARTAKVAIFPLMRNAWAERYKQKASDPDPIDLSRIPGKDDHDYMRVWHRARRYPAPVTSTTYATTFVTNPSDYQPYINAASSLSAAARDAGVPYDEIPYLRNDNLARFGKLLGYYDTFNNSDMGLVKGGVSSGEYFWRERVGLVGNEVLISILYAYHHRRGLVKQSDGSPMDPVLDPADPSPSMETLVEPVYNLANPPAHRLPNEPDPTKNFAYPSYFPEQVPTFVVSEHFMRNGITVALMEEYYPILGPARLVTAVATAKVGPEMHPGEANKYSPMIVTGIGEPFVDYAEPLNTADLEYAVKWIGANGVDASHRQPKYKPSNFPPGAGGGTGSGHAERLGGKWTLDNLFYEFLSANAVYYELYTYTVPRAGYSHFTYVDQHADFPRTAGGHIPIYNPTDTDLHELPYGSESPMAYTGMNLYYPYWGAKLVPTRFALVANIPSGPRTYLDEGPYIANYTADYTSGTTRLMIPVTSGSATTHFRYPVINGDTNIQSPNNMRWHQEAAELHFWKWLGDMPLFASSGAPLSTDGNPANGATEPLALYEYVRRFDIIRDNADDVKFAPLRGSVRPMGAYYAAVGTGDEDTPYYGTPGAQQGTRFSPGTRTLAGPEAPLSDAPDTYTQRRWTRYAYEQVGRAIQLRKAGPPPAPDVSAPTLP